jgi:hypothetical protein
MTFDEATADTFDGVLLPRGVINGKQMRVMTNSPTLHHGIRNTGGTWLDQKVAVDGNWFSSCMPADIPAFFEG